MARPLGTVAAATLTLFFTIAALLVFQLRSGRDPALGRQVAQAPAQVAPKPKRVLIRRVIVTRVVHDAPRATVPAPVQRTSTTPSAPAPAAPAPAPAAPAPLTTQSS
ncbi:MAG TPA: hypothetical protein VFX51_01540 [Solirubrobacteraceae bacterium]|nr:hypothetical protein [Solirubrobacteraceae bacterium]